jgi:hypothetical protein
MAKNTFEFGWISHCEHGNKIWGWFSDRTRDERIWNNYCFWAVCGKTISFTKYPHYDKHAINNLQTRKITNKYTPITMDKLLAMWPDFARDLDHKFVWDKLSEKI